jgi:hypothetical protein
MGLRTTSVIAGAVIAGFAASGFLDAPPGRAAGYASIAAAHANARPASAPGPGRVLGGFTSQGWPVVVVVSKNEQRIAALEAGLEMSCASGVQYSTLDYWLRLPIGARGKVKLAAAIVPIPSSAGATESLTGGTDSLAGKFNRTRTTFSGVWQLHLTFSSSSGTTDTCDSGAVNFSAVL